MVGYEISKNRKSIFSAPIDLIDINDCLNFIEQYDRKIYQYIVTPNVDHIVRINSDGNLHKIYDSAVLSLCDSRVVKLLAKLCFVKIPSVITGSDLTKLMFERVIKPDDDITIIGGATHSIERLQEKYRLKNVHHYNPPMRFIENEDEIYRCVQFIDANSSRYIFLAVGSPQQEILAHRIYAKGTSVGLGFCIGASLNFLTGYEKRAPRFVQKMALEWLFRLSQNPERLWRRYLVEDLKIFPIFLRCLWKKLTNFTHSENS